MATIIGTHPNTVTIEEVCEVIDGVVKSHQIVETGQYYNNFKTAHRHAKRFLLKVTLPEAEYEKRMATETRLKHAAKVIKMNAFMLDTQKYVDRWKGVIYTVSKERLLAESKLLVDATCEKYDFINAKAAIRYIKMQIK